MHLRIEPIEENVVILCLVLAADLYTLLQFVFM